MKAGVPKDRQVMGVPFYGKAEKNPTEAAKIFEYSVKYYEIPDILEKGLYKGKPVNLNSIVPTSLQINANINISPECVEGRDYSFINLQNQPKG